MSVSSPSANPALSGMQDIQLPADIGWWPLAPGWWALIVVALLLLIIAIVWSIRVLRRRRQHAAAAKSALQMLQQLDSQDPQLAVHVSALLKRTAISYGDRQQVAALTDDAWYRYLDAVLPAAERGQFAELLANRYRRPGSEVDGGTLIALCHRWLKHAPAYYQQPLAQRMAQANSEAAVNAPHQSNSDAAAKEATC
ncbi:DUF4381 domain-containing protein [Shewanella sp. A3A]|nr:DUF4381 domain-containing protein [Shewanella ferrihydritica]